MSSLPNDSYQAPLESDGITPEMVAMGVAELEQYDLQLGAPPDLMVIGIYRSMRVGALTKAVEPPKV